MQSRTLAALTAALLASADPHAPHQTAAPAPLTFDVISIKENPGPDYTFQAHTPTPD